LNSNVSLVIIGKPIGKNHLQLLSKPGFSDAIQLLNHSSIGIRTDSTFYQLIPLKDMDTISFHYNNIKIQASYDQQLLSFVEENRTEAEKRVFDVLANFVIKAGNKVSYLGIPPHYKDSTNQTRQAWTISIKETTEH
jgi:hypothetical protein